MHHAMLYNIPRLQAITWTVVTKGGQACACIVKTVDIYQLMVL